MRALSSIFVLAAALAVACGKNTEIQDYPCPKEGTKLTYDDFGKGFLDSYCQTCHGKSGSERNGAPSGYDFHDHASALHFKDRIFARAAADNTTMPPGPDDPPAGERAQLAEWLACGAP